MPTHSVLREDEGKEKGGSGQAAPLHGNADSGAPGAPASCVCSRVSSCVFSVNSLHPTGSPGCEVGLYLCCLCPLPSQPVRGLKVPSEWGALFPCVQGVPSSSCPQLLPEDTRHHADLGLWFANMSQASNAPRPTSRTPLLSLPPHRTPAHIPLLWK